MCLQKINFMLAGVGGQGTLLASDILADLGNRLGLDAKKAEIHGMAQRGGSVTSFVRWNEQVFSPIIAPGEVDLLIAFEKLEGLRYLHHLKPEGILLVNTQEIEPITVKAGEAVYPASAEIQAAFEQATRHVFWVDGLALAEKAGNVKTVNVVLLGALSALLEIPIADWLESVAALVPSKALQVNRQAFQLSREHVLTEMGIPG